VLRSPSPSSSRASREPQLLHYCLDTWFGLGAIGDGAKAIDSRSVTS